MTATKKTARGLIAALIILSFAILSLSSCSLSGDFVASRLEELGVPAFKHSKLKSVEVLYRDYYILDMPASEELAPLVAEHYFENYHEKIDTGSKNDVTDAVVRSYVAVIDDPYSFYRSSEEHKDYDATMSGTYFGIGVEVRWSAEDQTMTVTQLFDDGGAQEVGVKVGDLIISANGKLLSDIGYDAMIAEILGEIDTTVEITVLRGDEELSFTITRRKIVEKTVSYSIDENKIAYIKITSFKSNTPKQFNEAIDYIKSHGAVAVVYDLRGNGGGYLSALVDVVSHISPAGTLIASFSNGETSEWDTTFEQLALPTVVLCDEYTASAGELFTACMRDFGELELFEVAIVGTTTYGKGVMQRTFPFTDGSSLTITIAYYNPPSGENYDGIGITPDVVVELTDEGDAQLDAAYEEINKFINK